MTLIDGDRIITTQLYDDEHEEFIEKKMSIIDFVDRFSDEGVTIVDVIPNEYGRLIDADEVVKKICIEHKVNSIYELPDKLKSFVKKYLNEAPTILEPTPEYMIKNYAFSKSKECI